MKKFDYYSYLPIIAAIVLPLCLIFIVVFLNFIQPRLTLTPKDYNLDFKASNEPTFLFDTDGVIKDNQAPQNQASVLGTKSSEDTLEVAGKKITAKLIYQKAISEIKPIIVPAPENEGKFTIKVPKTNQFRPGKYTLEVSVDGKTVEQDFTWGVLAINTDQDVYQPNQKAYISLAVLDDQGEMACDAEVTLRIKSLALNSTDELSTKNGLIKVNPECQKHSAAARADYEASYQPSEIGEYQTILTAQTKSGLRIVQDNFFVEENPLVLVKRTSATRIYPPDKYKMTIQVTSRDDFSGTIEEFVPSSFAINPDNNFKIKKDPQGQSLAWQESFKAGQTKELSYIYKAPNISPQFYLLGRLSFKGSYKHEEKRFWQIAADQVPSGVIVAWPSTVGSIPSGWSRVADLDGYYLEGTTSNPSAVAGGSATHDHTSPSHTHTIGHTHTGSTSASAVPVGQCAAGGTTRARDGHSHTITTAANAGSNNGYTGTTATASNDPPYTTVIWIQSNGTTEIPSNAWAFFNSDTLPGSWTRQAGNKFLKGATAGSGGGSTGGSSDSHSHSLSHQHTEAAHTHTGTTDSNATCSGTTGSGSVAGAHTHTLSNGSTTATESSDSASTATGDGQPPWFKLNTIQNDTGAASLPLNTIAIWTGTIASIPSGWKACDGTNGTPNLNDKFIKGANANGEITATGGALTHTHGAGANHTHTINNHTHAFNTSTFTATNKGTTGVTASGSHNHGTLSLSGSSTTGTATISANANTENRPPYKEVVFIQYQGATTPDNPSSLTQKKTDDTTLSTGAWTNETSVKYTATVTDPGSNQVQICVEKDILGTSFSNTEDSCGTLVNSGQTASVTISGQTDASQYHWQARAKNSLGNYSSWVSYDVNAESDRDYGIDTTAPTGGTVNDGSAGDQDWNNGDLDTIEANWSGIDSNASGLSKYEYAIRKESNNYYWSVCSGAGIWQVGANWCNNSTNASFTQNNVNLKTGESYYVSVRTTDNAGNLSTALNSDGQQVLPNLSFFLSGNTITFADLNDSNSWTDTEVSTITTSTNASSGYTAQAYETQVLTSLSDPSDTITNFSASWASPKGWNAGTYGFGYTSNDTSVQGSNRFGSNPCTGGDTPPCYAPFSQTASGNIVADHTATVNGDTGAISSEVFTITYKVAVSSSQAAATYQTYVIYTVTANF